MLDFYRDDELSQAYDMPINQDEMNIKDLDRRLEYLFNIVIGCISWKSKKIVQFCIGHDL